MRKRLFLMILLLTSVQVFCLAEHEPWICTVCGRAENKGSFCGGCGNQAPWMGSWICETCGTENEAENLFCIECGTQKGTIPSWFCENCGIKNPAENVFCENCGKAKESVSQSEPQMSVKGTPAPSPSRLPVVMITPRVTDTPSPSPIPSPTPTPKPTSTPTPKSTPTPTPKPTPTPTPKATLSPNNKCPVQPIIYSNPRALNLSTDKAYDLNKKLSASTIEKDLGTREYGLYFKFTPGGKDNGYVITRFDVIITGPDHTIVHKEGFNDYMECRRGYYWFWDFFSLQEMFEKQLKEKGSIQTGNYTMDVYFNGLWAGKTAFLINK